jgi:hypothetical protein
VQLKDLVGRHPVRGKPTATDTGTRRPRMHDARA